MSQQCKSGVGIWTEVGHLLAWALLIGTQFWVTLVSGPSLFRAVSLDTFKEVQSVLLPKYFLAQTLLYSGLLFVFLIRLRPRLSEGTGARYGGALLLATVLAVTHQFVLGPAVTHAMEAKLPSFRKLHGCSMAVNVAQMGISLAYLRLLLVHLRAACPCKKAA